MLQVIVGLLAQGILADQRQLGEALEETRNFLLAEGKRHLEPRFPEVFCHVLSFSWTVGKQQHFQAEAQVR